MRNFIQSPRWWFRIALVRLGERFADSSARRTRRSYDLMQSPAGLAWDGFVSRFSTFSPHSGYSRRRLRRLLWSLRFPSLILRDIQWELAGRLHTPILGRFEGHSDPAVALKAEWLVDEAEATTSFGDMTEWVYVAAWLDYDVPWSATPENWIGILDGHGFWSLEQYPERYAADTRVDQLEREWQGFETDGEDEPEPYVGWDNREYESTR